MSVLRQVGHLFCVWFAFFIFGGRGLTKLHRPSITLIHRVNDREFYLSKHTQPTVRSDDHYSYSVVALALFVRQDIFGRSVHCLWRRSPAQLFQQLAFVHLLPHMLILSNNLTIEHFYNSCPKTCILRRLHTGSLTVIPPGNSIWKHVPRVRPWTGGKRPRGNRVWSYSLFPRIFRISIIKGFWGHETQMFLINNIYSTRTDV